MLMTADEVLALSPDAASTKAAQGLVKPNKWGNAGHNDVAVWGECQGSGSRPYQTQVDLAGPSFKCSCPSRKFPCKHGLALLLLRAAQSVDATDTPPTWVQEWLDARQQRSEKKETNQAAKIAKAADPQAIAKKEGSRWHKAQAGLQELSLWLQDTLNQGLARLSQNHTWAEQTYQIAAHMVDAQMPALKTRLEDIVALVDVHPQWPQQVLIQLSDLQLVLDAAARWDDNTLDDHFKARLTQYLGWSVDKAEVMAQGEAVNDVWHVIGTRHIAQDNMTERHVWLQGQDTGRLGLLLDFAFQNRGFEHSFGSGTSHQGTVHFYPGQLSMRAVTGLDFEFCSSPIHAHELTQTNIWDTNTLFLTHNPWQHMLPLWLLDAQLQYHQDAWHLVFEQQNTPRILPIALNHEHLWRLLACLHAGQRLHWFGEWRFEHFQLLSVWEQSDDATVNCVWSLPKEFQA